MRLRRLEFVVIGVTLAFACFLGGFFTGRNWSAVNFTAVATQNEAPHNTGAIAHPPEVSLQEPADIPLAPSIPANDIPVITPVNPEPEAPPEAVGAPRAGDGKININLASQSELTDLPGIGNVLASRIVDYRRQHGDFQRIEDIKNVTGIGEKRFETIRDKITVG